MFTNPLVLIGLAIAGLLVISSRRSSSSPPALDLVPPDVPDEPTADDPIADTAVYPQPLCDLARAISVAEGFGRAGTIPTRAHNPGDLVIPGWTGAMLGDQGISVFSSDTEGWSRLYHQLDLIVRGKSHVYTLNDTLTTFGAKWTATASDDWTTNVVTALQDFGYSVDASSTLRDTLQL